MALLSPVSTQGEWKDRAAALRSGEWVIDVNEVDPRTQYPLLHAFVFAHSRQRKPVLEQDEKGAHEVVRALLELGANPARCVRGATALDWCLANRDWDMAQVLERALPCAVYSVEQEKLLTVVEDGLFEFTKKEIVDWMDAVHMSFGTLNPDVRGISLQWALVNSYLTDTGFRTSDFDSIANIAAACAKHGLRDEVGLWTVAAWSAAMREYYSTDDGYHEQGVWEDLAKVNHSCIDALSGGQRGESGAWRRLVYHIENVLAAGCPLAGAGQLKWAKTCIAAAACVEHMLTPVSSQKTGKAPPESPYRAKLAVVGWEMLALGIRRTLELEPTITAESLNKLFSKGNPDDAYSRGECFAVDECFLQHRPSDISLWETLAPMSYMHNGTSSLRPVNVESLANEVPPPSTHAAMKMLVARNDELGRAARKFLLDERLPATPTLPRPRM